MSKLASKIRAARESKVEIDGVTYRFRRPTDVDILEISAKASAGQFRPRELLGFYYGWEGMTEGHMINGGDPHPLDFDPEAFVEFVADRLEHFNTLTSALMDAYHAHQKAAEKARKN